MFEILYILFIFHFNQVLKQGHEILLHLMGQFIYKYVKIQEGTKLNV